MRTTLDIDDDILSAAKELARYENKSTGKVLSDLARKALTRGGAQAGGDKIITGPGGFPCLPAGGRIVTNEMIRKLQDEIDREEVEAANALQHQRPAGPG